jgi:hypothetical protein
VAAPAPAKEPTVVETQPVVEKEVVKEAPAQSALQTVDLHKVGTPVAFTDEARALVAAESEARALVAAAPEAESTGKL